MTTTGGIFHSKAPCGTPGATMKTRMSEIPKKSGGGRRARNRYDANCYFCGAPVSAGAGCVEKSDKHGWVVFC